MSKQFAVGDLVTVDPPDMLRSGCEWYPDAVVIRVDPLALASREGDMLWTATLDGKTFRKVGHLGWWKRRHAMSRLPCH